MKIYKIIVLIGILILIMACKQNNEVPGSESINKNTQLTEEEYIGIYQYFTQTPRSLFEKEQNEIIDFAVSKNISLKRTNSGLFYSIEEIGDGDFLKWGEEIVVHYSGKFLNNQIFDSSYKRGKPIRFKIGEMISGWNEGLQLVKDNSKLHLFIPSHLGYGEKGFPGYVPPNKIIFFELEILNQSK